MSGLVAKTETVTLPSGQKIVVREPGLRTLQYARQALGEEDEPTTAKQATECGIRLVVSCAIDPPLTNDPEQVGKDAGDGKVYSDLEDLGLTDTKALIEHFTSMLGTEGAKEEIAPLSPTSESLQD